MNESQPKISWWVPWQSRTTEVASELQKELAPGRTLRAIVIGITVSLIGVYLARAHWGLGIPLGELARILLTGVGILVLQLGVCALLCFVPPIVYIQKQGIGVQNGQTFRWHAWKDVQNLSVEDGVLDYVYREKRYRYALSKRISLATLHQIIDAYRTPPPEKELGATACCHVA